MKNHIRQPYGYLIFTPIGGQRDIDVDVRVIATTNRDMITEVKEKKFREDLYYRLNVFPLETLNLSERPNDIIPISVALLRRHTDFDKIPYITENAQKILTDYAWPGNVRELENVLQRALVLCVNNQIMAEDIMVDGIVDAQMSERRLFQKEQQPELRA